MLKEFSPDGNLVYTFLDVTKQLKPMYMMRGIGGTMYIVGSLIMVYNLWKTAASGKLVANEAAEAPALRGQKVHDDGYWHRWVERRPIALLVLALVVILVGGIVEFLPTFLIKSNIPTISTVKPYTPLELQGRDIYVREGCYTCHSQMIRPFRSETARYGDYSKGGEFIYDHPFQWGSKRTGPDLAREGGRQTNVWHFNHMYDPTSTSPGSIMPRYPWLFDDLLDTASTPAKIRAMQTLGVPYPAGYDAVANKDLRAQANTIKENLAKEKIMVNGDEEIIGLIAYLQRIGTDIKAEKKDNTLNTK
jgi:cytochrome c oxidase cbb3-type subunit I/II